jgi:ribosome-associated translation inhibitor RaiA
MTIGTNDHALRVQIDSGSYHLSASMRAKMDSDLGTLRKVVESFPISELKVDISQQNSTIHVATSLRLASQTLFTGDTDEQLHPAWERCVHKLVHKVRAFKERLGNKSAYSKEAEGTSHTVRPSMEPDVAALSASVAELDYAAFRDAVGVYDEQLEKRIGRVVQRHPAMEKKLGNGITISQIMEEVYLNAFERFEHHSAQVPLGEWLEQLIEPSIEVLERHPAEEIENLDLVQSANEATSSRAKSQKNGASSS